MDSHQRTRKRSFLSPPCAAETFPLWAEQGGPGSFSLLYPAGQWEDEQVGEAGSSLGDIWSYYQCSPHLFLPCGRLERLQQTPSSHSHTSHSTALITTSSHLAQSC